MGAAVYDTTVVSGVKRHSSKAVSALGPSLLCVSLAPGALPGLHFPSSLLLLFEDHGLEWQADLGF